MLDASTNEKLQIQRGRIGHKKKEINPKKAPGFDLITGKVLKEITEKCIQKITQIFNAVLRVEYYPLQ
jgi:hypothetical protein